MKILQIIESLAPGGGERFVVDLSNELVKNNELNLLTFRQTYNTFFYKDDLSPNIKHFNYNGNSSIVSKIIQVFIIIKYIYKLKPEIIHAHLVAFNYIIIPSIIFPKIKFYYTVHNIASQDVGHKLLTIAKKVLFRKKIRPITISKSCEFSFEEFFKFKSFSVIENGCRRLNTTINFQNVCQEIEKYKKTPTTKIYLNVGRLMVQKNHELLIHSFNYLIDKGEDAILLIIGEYDNFAERKRELDKLIKNDRILFLGTKNNITDYLANAHFFCLSSAWEGLPISLLEAGFSGVYPICTPVGGIPDVILNENWGLLSKDVSLESYKEALYISTSIIHDRNKLKNIYAKKYSIENCSNSYEKAYSE